MATKARTRQKKTKSRPYGRYLLLLLALSCLAGIGYFIFLQAPLFPDRAEQAPPTSEVAAAQPTLDEPLATTPTEPLPAAPAVSETMAAASATVTEPPPPAPPTALPPEPAIAPPTAPKQMAPPTPAKPTPIPAVEQPRPTAKPATQQTAPPHKKPMVAIIIDDMGYQPAIGRKMLALPLNLSFSFLPSGPQTKELAAAAHGKKRDILLHLPMEATDHKVDPGPGTLNVAMAAEEMQQKLANHLALVPMAIGINNHMGSRFTEERLAMATLLAEIKQRGLFFLDSRTSTKSVACAVAKETGVPCLSRHLFLDNDQNQAAVAKQLDALLALAEKNGQAVGIGHPHPATLAALTARQHALSERVELVGVGTLFRNQGR